MHKQKRDNKKIQFYKTTRFRRDIGQSSRTPSTFQHKIRTEIVVADHRAKNGEDIVEDPAYEKCDVSFSAQFAAHQETSPKHDFHT